MRSEYDKGYDKGFTAGYFWGLTKIKKEYILKILAKQDQITEDVKKGIDQICDLDKLEEIFDSLI